jgi:hypothetical protein
LKLAFDVSGIIQGLGFPEFESFKKRDILAKISLFFILGNYSKGKTG